MKITCTQENLSQALSALDRVVGKQSSLPILSNFLLETEKGRLKVSATNLEIGVVVYVGAKIETEGKLAVPAKIFANFIQNLPSGEVLTMEVVKQHLFLESGGYTMKIKGLDGKDFPIIPQFKSEYPFALPAQFLKQALSRLLFCVSTNESRLELTGVQIAFYEDSLHIAATDSFRLAEEIIPYSNNAGEYQSFVSSNPSLILPSNTLQELMRVIGPEAEEVKIALEENQLFFEVDNAQIISRVISGKFPDYKQIIPKTFSLQVLLEKEVFLRSLRIASTLSSYNAGEIALIFSPDEKSCTIVSKSQEIGENTSIMPAEFLEGGAPITFVFNPRYIMEGLAVFSSDKILFLGNTATTPVAFRSFSEDEKGSQDGYVYIIMPIRKEYA